MHENIGSFVADIDPFSSVHLGTTLKGKLHMLIGLGGYGLIFKG